MEEILASIRQTLAEEQDGGKSALADRSAPGLFARTNGVPRPGTPPTERKAPSLGRLTDALKQHAPPPANGLASKRPSSFDDDLADILDESLGQNGLTAPKPSLSIAPDVPGFLVPRTSETKAAPAAPQPQTFPAPASEAFPKEFEAAAPQPPQPAPAKAASTPFPMRRGGFYPPAGYVMPTLPPLPELPPAAEPPRSEPAAEKAHPDVMVKRLAGLGAPAPSPSATAAPSAEPSPSIEAEKPLGAAEPAASASDRPVAPEPEPQLGPAPTSQSQAAAAPPAEPEPKLAPTSEAPRPGPLAAGLAESIAAAAAAPETPAASPSPPSVAEEPVAASEPDLVIDAVIEEILAEPEPIEVPAAPIHVLEPAPIETLSPAYAAAPAPVEKPAPPPHYNGVHYNGAAAAAPPMGAPQPSAAKLALDALAQGLAAASSHPIPPQPSFAPGPDPRRNDPYGHLPAATLVPVEPDHQYPAAGSRMPAVSHYDPQLPVRTLEDTVADMLKPMLQQWLADNMPRIIEKALRVEAASAVKRGHKP